MKNKQLGVSLVGMIVVLIVLIVAGIFAMKIVPAYIEFGKVKKTVVAIVQSGDAKGGVAEIKGSFNRRAQIDDVDAITANDLDITKDGDKVVISFAYQKKVPLFANVSLLIEFSGNSSGI